MTVKTGRKKPPVTKVPEKKQGELPKKDPRGRATKDFADNFKFVSLKGYYEENEKTEPLFEQQTAPTQETEVKKEAQENVATEEQVKQAIKETVLIEVAAENLELADAFFTGIADKILKRIGFSMELEPMTDNDLEIWAKLAPPLELERSWKNFFIFFLIAKMKN